MNSYHLLTKNPYVFRMMGTNYIGAFALTKVLQPLLEKSPIPSRIVNVSSFTHWNGKTYIPLYIEVCFAFCRWHYYYKTSWSLYNPGFNTFPQKNILSGHIVHFMLMFLHTYFLVKLSTLFDMGKRKLYLIPRARVLVLTICWLSADRPLFWILHVKY